jgi:hypothetical protein
MASDTQHQRVEVNYQKSGLFRVVHADGFWGGPTPKGNIHFACYSERPAIPRRTTFEVKDGIPASEQIVET